MNWKNIMHTWLVVIFTLRFVIKAELNTLKQMDINQSIKLIWLLVYVAILYIKKAKKKKKCLWAKKEKRKLWYKKEIQTTEYLYTDYQYLPVFIRIDLTHASIRRKYIYDGIETLYIIKKIIPLRVHYTCMYEIIFCILSTSVMELHTSKHKKYKCKFIQSLIYNF